MRVRFTPPGQPAPEVAPTPVATAPAPAPAPVAALPAAAPTPPAPSTLSWENTTLPKSEVVSGQFLKQTARFTNNLKTPVTVASIRPSCSCTVVSGADQTVAPGGKGEITIQINTAGQPIGELSKAVTIITTEDGKACTTLISIPYTTTAAASAAQVPSAAQASTPSSSITVAHESGVHSHN